MPVAAACYRITGNCVYATGQSLVATGVVYAASYLDGTSLVLL